MERKHQCFANTQTTEDLMLLCYTQRFYVRQLKPLLTGKISIHSQIKITVTFFTCFHHASELQSCRRVESDFPPQLNFYFYLVDVMLGNTWGMWFALQIQVYGCFFIARNNIYSHKMSGIDGNLGKCKRKYFSESLSSRSVGFIATNVSSYKCGTTSVCGEYETAMFLIIGSSPLCHTECIFMSEENSAKSFLNGYISSCLVQKMTQAAWSW